MNGEDVMITGVRGERSEWERSDGVRIESEW